jgi:sulfatase modifying factor 1
VHYSYAFQKNVTAISTGLPVARAFAILAVLGAGVAAVLPGNANGGVYSRGGMLFAPVGDAGNQASDSGYGSVAYAYGIGIYEVTVGQYAELLNAVAASDPFGLYDPNMTTFLNSASIARAGVDGAYEYTVIGSPAKPITMVSWFDAARFANWMHNGKPSGSQDASTTEDGAYSLNGSQSGVSATRNPGARFWLPSADEWYKAAYYKGGGLSSGYWEYATQSDSLPGNAIGSLPNQANIYTGFYAVTQQAEKDEAINYLTDVGAFAVSASAYGIYDMTGNVNEWTDTVFGTNRGSLGGGWDYWVRSGIPGADNDGIGVFPTGFSDFQGFRLATTPVPEPAYSVGSVVFVGSLLCLCRRHRRLAVLARNGSGPG